MNRWDQLPLPRIVAAASHKHAAIQSELTIRQAEIVERLRYSGLTWTLTLAAVVVLPILAPLCLIVCVTAPVAATQPEIASDWPARQAM
jgi:hypothetical protein